MNKIIYTQKFIQKLREIFQKRSYIPKDFDDIILLKIENLKTFPKMYPKIKNQYRKIPVQKYIILYEIRKKDIYIINSISTKSKYYNQLEH